MYESVFFWRKIFCVHLKKKQHQNCKEKDVNYIKVIELSLGKQHINNHTAAVMLLLMFML